MKGKFFVFEGPDHCGKTTVVRRLEKEFPGSVVTREPGGTPFAEELRKLLLYTKEGALQSGLTQLLTFFVARSSHFDEVIGPNIAGGKNVLCDRMDASTYAFQIFGKENPGLISLFFQLRRMIVEGYHPHYIYFNLSPESCLKRGKNIQDTEKSHFDLQPIEFYRRVTQGYEAFFEYPSVRPFVTVIDAEPDEETVYQSVLTEVRRVLAP